MQAEPLPSEPPGKPGESNNQKAKRAKEVSDERKVKLRV